MTRIAVSACRLSAFMIFLSYGAFPEEYDVLVRGGTLYDGSGGPPRVGDVAINGDVIVALGEIEDATGRIEIKAHGLAVAPGFINMLSHATSSLIVDPRSMSDILQGVTLEVFGESSMGPLNDAMKTGMKDRQGDLKFDVEWTTLGEYLEFLEARGIAPNVASFVGASTIRVHEIGRADRPPSHEELERMKALVEQAMEEGALGVTSALIYAPATYASTDELVELARAASKHGGRYIAHIRSEGNTFLEAIDETLTIAKKAGIPVEIYHLKAAGKKNWHKMDLAIQKIEDARANGTDVTANMYTYIAGATGLDASMPPWVQEGGYEAWSHRLMDPQVRERVKAEMNRDTDEWENLFHAAGPEKMLLIGFKNEDLKPLTGKTLAEVAQARETTPAELAMDLVVEDGSRVGTVYFLMTEENVKKQIALPWVSFGSDAGSLAAEGAFLKSSAHPRAYGNFARLLGKYVRDESVIPLEEAIRKLTSFPAENLRIRNRGRLAPGYYADLAIFDPEAIQDPATFEKPHQYSTGMVHVLVNGIQVLSYGEHTGATPGRVVRGPGWTGWND